MNVLTCPSPADTCTDPSGSAVANAFNESVHPTPNGPEYGSFDVYERVNTNGTPNPANRASVAVVEYAPVAVFTGSAKYPDAFTPSTDPPLPYTSAAGTGGGGQYMYPPAVVEVPDVSHDPPGCTAPDTLSNRPDTLPADNAVTDVPHTGVYDPVDRARPTAPTLVVPPAASSPNCPGPPASSWSRAP